MEWFTCWRCATRIFSPLILSFYSLFQVKRIVYDTISRDEILNHLDQFFLSCSRISLNQLEDELGLCLIGWVFLGVGMGMYSREGSTMECVIFIYNNWNAVSGSKLGGVFVSRKLCEWIRSSDPDLRHLGASCWFGSLPQGTLHSYFVISI